jgi:membrane-associated phospholipid phosphatase
MTNGIWISILGATVTLAGPASAAAPQQGAAGVNHAAAADTTITVGLRGTHADVKQPRDGGARARRAARYRMTVLADGALLGAGLGGVAIVNSMGENRTALTEAEAARLTRESVIWFDRSATSRYSPDLIATSEDIASVLAYAPLALLLDPGVRRDWSTFGVMYVQTTLLSSAAANLAKESIHRYRPYVFNPDLTYEEKTARDPGKAFFSSAATYAFARAVFLSTVFSEYNPDSRWKPVVWAGSLGTAAVVGYLRYESGLHYPSDVVVGAIVGSAIGYAVPRLHRAGSRGVNVTPIASGAVAGARVEFRF